MKVEFLPSGPLIDASKNQRYLIIFHSANAFRSPWKVRLKVLTVDRGEVLIPLTCSHVASPDFGGIKRQLSNRAAPICRKKAKSTTTQSRPDFKDVEIIYRFIEYLRNWPQAASEFQGARRAATIFDRHIKWNAAFSSCTGDHSKTRKADKRATSGLGYLE